jgi:hypothetical protein
MTDHSQPAQGRFESTPAPGSWWNEVHRQQTGITARCATCDIDTRLVLFWKGGDSPADSRHELPLCERCADQVNAILATRCRPGGRWDGMPRDLAIESAVLHVQPHSDQD